MKVLTILGTRPEIIRLSLIMRKLDLVCDHRVLHTGQNYDPNLHDIFFKEFGLRQPDVQLKACGSFASQLAEISLGVEKEILENRPDKVLILGDTNSALAAITAERMGVPVYHMEAGNRCFDLNVPEERNRRIVDHTCSFNLVYTENSKQNLLREGIPVNKILVTGNPLREVINTAITTNPIYGKAYVIVTCHRAENVDNKEALSGIIGALRKIAEVTPVIFSCHPKTEQRLKEFGINTGSIDMRKPMGFYEFIRYQSNASIIIGDSGTATSEEAAILGVPAISVRNTTERPETVENGSVIVAGTSEESIINAYKTIVSLLPYKVPRIPDSYMVENVSDIVVKFLMGVGL